MRLQKLGKSIDIQETHIETHIERTRTVVGQARDTLKTDIRSYSWVFASNAIEAVMKQELYQQDVASTFEFMKTLVKFAPEERRLH